jgi:hypothetical protein
VHLRNSKYYFRYNNILDIPQVRTSRYGKKTFKFAAATLWNSLPDHIFLEFFSVQKCQAKGQKLKLLRIKVWKIVSLFNLFKKGPKRLIMFSCWAMALETFKIMNKLSPSCLHSLVHLRNSKYYFRYNNILDIPQVRTSRYGNDIIKQKIKHFWIK